MQKRGSMEGIKEFSNDTCYELKVELTVRAGEKIGCTARTEEFCLQRGECKIITYGNDANPFLDGIHACASNHNQCSETGLFVRCPGSAVDKLINAYNHISFLLAAQSIVISAHNCKF
jgi:hypothetical protein